MGRSVSLSTVANNAGRDRLGTCPASALTIPILGVRTLNQLTDTLGALDGELEAAADLQRLDEASKVPLGFPGDFGGASLAYGDIFVEVADHHLKTGPLV